MRKNKIMDEEFDPDKTIDGTIHKFASKAYGSGRIDVIDELLTHIDKHIISLKKKIEHAPNTHAKAQAGGKLKAYKDLSEYLRVKIRKTIR